MRLNDVVIRNLPAPASGQKRYMDDALPGFGIRVSKGGTKTWIVISPASATRAQQTLGRYGVVSLQDARSEAKVRLAELTLGKHKPRAITWKLAVEQYLAEIARKRKVRTHADYKRLLGRHFKFGPTQLADISTHDIQRRIDKLADTPSEQHHAFVVVRAFFNWAYRRHYFDLNPMGRMKPPAPGRPRERILSDDELCAVWKACQPGVYGDVVKLLILTGQRIGEITHIERSMLNDDTITLPASHTKNSRQHTFPIGRRVQDILNANPRTDGLLFPNALDDKRPFIPAFKSKQALDQRSGVSNWTHHDLRRTFASGLAAEGVQLPVIEKLLNHISGSFGGIVGVYQRHNFLPEMQDAMARWENHLDSILSGSYSTRATGG